MKKIMVLTISVVVVLALNVPSFALELSTENVANVPSSYAKVKNDTIVFGDKSVYTAVSLNQIFNAYGIMLASENVANVPPSYAKVKNDTIVFGEMSVYTAESLNQILNAYSK